MNPFKLIMRLLGWVLKELYLLVGNYGLALILLAILVKLILLPMAVKAKKSSMKMARLTPRMKELERRYGANKTRYQQAVMELYRDEGVSTTGGCLWSLIPMLILLPLFYTIRAPLTYMMGLSADSISTLRTTLEGMGLVIQDGYYSEITIASHIHDNFAAMQAVVPNVIDINFDFLGISLSQIPTFKFWANGITWASVGLFLIPLISGGAQFLSIWLTQKLNNSVAVDANGMRTGDKAAQEANPAAQSMKYMTIVMPLMSVYIGFVVPAGIGIYWIIQALFTLAQEFFLTRRYRKSYDEEDAIKQEAFLKKLAEEDERERRRAERRAQNPDGQQDPNTSKKKLKTQQKSQDAAAAAEYAASQQPEGAADPADKHFSGDPERPNSRGRAYKADRYAPRGKAAQTANETAVPAAPAAEPVEAAPETAQPAPETAETPDAGQE